MCRYADYTENYVCSLVYFGTLSEKLFYFIYFFLEKRADKSQR